MAAEIIVKVLIERKNEQSGGNVVTKAETEIFLLSRESLEKNERVMDYTRFSLVLRVPKFVPVVLRVSSLSQ